MVDLDMRTLERRTLSGDCRDHAAYLRAQLRAGELEQERLRAAAFLGHSAAQLALDTRERLETPSRWEHSWRRRVHAVVSRVDRWLDEEALREPYTLELREWVQSLAPLGRVVADELGRILLRLVADDWSRLSRCLDPISRSRRSDSAWSELAEAAAAACWRYDPRALQLLLRDALVDWGLGLPPGDPVPREPVRETAEGDPMTKLCNRIIEDAYSRSAACVVIEPEEPASLVVSYDIRKERSRRMELPRKVGPSVFARLAFMAGLEVLASGPRTGRIHFARWSRKQLDLELQATVHPEAESCSLVLIGPGQPLRQG